MTDALSLVRQATMSKNPVNYVDGAYIFGSLRVPENVKTCFRRSIGNTVYYYSIREIIFFLENAELSLSEYRRKALEHRLTAVITADSQNLRDYLTGAIDTCQQIDTTAIAESALGTIIENVNDSTSSKVQDAKRDNSTELRDSSMSNDKINELRALRLAHKRKETDGLEPGLIENDLKALATIRANEYPSKTRTSVLSLPASGPDYANVLKLFGESVLKPREEDANKRSKLATEQGSASTKRPYAVPIIMLPNSKTGILTSLNAIDFLDKGMYIPLEEKAKQGAKREQEQIITRQVTVNGVTRPAVFKLMDNAALLRPQDWERVVAVFSTGQEWQFRDWKWANPVELFQQVFGAHLTLDDVTINPKVLSWNCKILKVNRFKRHQDTEAANEFWALLDDFIRLKKPWLIAPVKNH